MKKTFNTMTYLFLVTLLITLISCGGTTQDAPPPAKKESDAMNQMNKIAESYIKLSFQLGKHDADYVDAYFGPENLKPDPKTETLPLPQIIDTASQLLEQLKPLDIPATDNLKFKRHQNLAALLTSLKARAEILNGKKMSFDEESFALYNAVSPTQSTEHYEAVLTELEQLLPGEGTLEERLANFESEFIVPADKMDAVFKTAIDECRKRTKAHLQLPENESFTMEYVKDKPWGAYNWFKGNSQSLIQFNTDIPMTIDRPVGLASHEGYPGHHVYYSLFEKKFYKELGWVEFSIYPLFSPASLIAEGTANFGIDVAFPGEERIKFEKEVLFPLAGLNPEKADLYYKIQALKSKLSFGGNDTCRLYLDGKITKEEAVQRFMKYQLRSRQRSEKYLSFVDRYRSYVINYNLGQQMVEDYINNRGGTADNPEKRWEEFIQLMSTPILPQDLVVNKDKTETPKS